MKKLLTLMAVIGASLVALKSNAQVYIAPPPPPPVYEDGVVCEADFPGFAYYDYPAWNGHYRDYHYYAHYRPFFERRYAGCFYGGRFDYGRFHQGYEGRGYEGRGYYGGGWAPPVYGGRGFVDRGYVNRGYARGFDRGGFGGRGFDRGGFAGHSGFESHGHGGFHGGGRW